MVRVMSISIFFSIRGSFCFCSFHFFWLGLFPYSLFLIPLSFWSCVYLFIWFLFPCPWLTLCLFRGVHYCRVSVLPSLFALLAQIAMELSHLRMLVSSNTELIHPGCGFILKKNL